MTASIFSSSDWIPVLLPGRARSVLLPRKSEGLYLVQRVRDEAHRFAITAHRNRRSKLGLASQLDAVPGGGDVTDYEDQLKDAFRQIADHRPLKIVK